MNKLSDKTLYRTLLKYSLASILTVITTVSNFAQEVEFDNGVRYVIGDVSVSGNTNFSAQTVVTYSGLRKGDPIVIPGEKIGDAIKRLWTTNLFSDIAIYIIKIEDNAAFLEIRLVDLPELNEVRIEGVKKKKIEEIIKENKLIRGVKITENLITTTKNYLTNKYRKTGYLNTEVNIISNEVVDSLKKVRVNMLVTIDKGEKIKVEDIVFFGNEALTDKKLRKTMKNTKKKNPIRVLKRSKYIEADFREDLTTVVNKYKENGYRDARIISDTIIKNNDNTVVLQITIEENIT